MGRMVDYVGRKRIIIMGRLIMYAATVIFLLGGGVPFLIFSWMLMGVNDATGIAWSAKEAELVTPDKRSRMTALSNGAFNALAVPASILGGFLWDRVSLLAPFIVMVIIDGCVRMPMIHFLVPEGNRDPIDGETDEGFSP